MDQKTFLRRSKRQKDLADIMRIIESFPLSMFILHLPRRFQRLRFMRGIVTRRVQTNVSALVGLT